MRKVYYKAPNRKGPDPGTQGVYKANQKWEKRVKKDKKSKCLSFS